MPTQPEDTHRYWLRTGTRLEKEIGALQLVRSGKEDLPTSVTVGRGRWTEAARTAFHAILADARTKERPKVQLPYRTLCAALQVSLPNASHVHHDIMETLGDRFPDAVFEIPETETANALARAHQALANWIENKLAKTVEAWKIHGSRVSVLRDLAAKGTALRLEDTSLVMPTDILGSKSSFPQGRDAILAYISQSLVGKSPFSSERIGPLYAVVRSDTKGNGVDFMSWPFLNGDMLVSVVVHVTVETAPWTPSPIVRVDVSKRRWLKGVPGHFGVQRNAFGYAMQRDRPTAINFPIPLKGGQPSELDTPALILRLLDANNPEAVSQKLSDLLSTDADGRTFIGLPYKTTYRKMIDRKSPGSGASSRDAVEAFVAVADCLKPLGFEEAPGVATGHGLGRIDHYGTQNLSYLAPEHLVLAHDEWVATGQGAPAWPAKGNPPPVKSKVAADLAAIREVHDQRLSHAYGAGSSVIVRVFARKDDDWLAVRLVARALYGDRVTVEAALLPQGIHGPFLKGDTRDKASRSAEAIGAWRGEAERFAETCSTMRPGQPRLALVMAPMFYTVTRDGKSTTLSDDPVAKPASRTALAQFAEANTQFLVPWAQPDLRTDEPKLKGYGLRIQAALDDLLFGHCGLITPLAPVMAKVFPKGRAPTCIVGLTLIRKNRGQRGGDANSILAAIKLGATVVIPPAGKAGGTEVPRLDETLVRLGWREDATAKLTPWMPYAEGLRRVATGTVGSIGHRHAEKSDTVIDFVTDVLQELRNAGERPLVLIDATGLAGLWTWLSDRQITGPMCIGGRIIDPAVDFPGFRFVRMRSFGIPRVVTHQNSRFQAITEAGDLIDDTEVIHFTPTVTAGIVRMTEAGVLPSHHLVTMGYSDINHRTARGRSAFAEDSILVKLVPGTSRDWPEGLDVEMVGVHGARIPTDTGLKPYRRPETLDLSMPVLCDGDDPDRIASLIMLLRGASGHTDASTFLPAPLSFERQMKNYMPRYILQAEDIAEVPGEDTADDEDDVLDD